MLMNAHTSRRNFSYAQYTLRFKLVIPNDDFNSRDLEFLGEKWSFISISRSVDIKAALRCSLLIRYSCNGKHNA